jgi:hypothetical protein
MSRAGVGAGHVGELALRRHRAGEAVGDAVAAHVAACADCRARGRALDDEQRRFERDVSFDRFAAGVERAARGDRRRRRPSAPLAWVLAPMIAAAATLALVVTFVPGPRGPNRTKGGAWITVRVAGGDGTQRTAAAEAPEVLAPGDRVRIGYEPGAHRYLLALSVDDHGAVTPLYPEAGRSVSADKASGGALRYLPDSLEFTGAGAERLVVVLSEQPLEVEAARRAARSAFDRARGDVRRLPALDLPGEQFQRTFIKP